MRHLFQPLSDTVNAGLQLVLLAALSIPPCASANTNTATSTKAGAGPALQPSAPPPVVPAMSASAATAASASAPKKSPAPAKPARTASATQRSRPASATSLAPKARSAPTPLAVTAPAAGLIQRTSLKDASAGNLNLAAWCDRIAGRLPSLTTQQCRDTALVAGDGRSVNGLPLWFRDIAPAHAPERLRVLVLGGIHGDEMASVSLVFDWISRSLKLNDEPIYWRMVPLVNPDGLLHQPSRRMNAHGVDLNRNFSTPDWDVQAKNYWVGRTGKDPRRFPGPNAMSEPETRWIQKQIELFKPNLIVSVHAPFGVLDFDGPPPVPGKLGSLYLDQVGIYPGSLGNYGGVVLQVPVVTIELKNARQVAVAEVGAMWSDLLAWIDRRLINVAQDASSDRKVR
jgi:hypothetical protein